MMELTEEEKADVRGNIIRQAMTEAREKIATLEPEWKESFYICVLGIMEQVDMGVGVPAARIDPLAMTSDAHPIMQMAILVQCLKMMYDHSQEPMKAPTKN